VFPIFVFFVRRIARFEQTKKWQKHLMAKRCRSGPLRPNVRRPFFFALDFFALSGHRRKHFPLDLTPEFQGEIVHVQVAAAGGADVFAVYRFRR
jgi:hypothetical protein